jgi:FkbM family methyltransferase
VEVSKVAGERTRSTDSPRTFGPVGRVAAGMDGTPIEREASATEVVPPPDIPLNALYDEQTEQVLRRILRPGDSCLDVGANEGTILRTIVARAPAGRHHAFEPIPELAEALRSRFPGVSVHEVALAAASGSTTFHHVVSNPSYSGLRERRYDRDGEEVSLITVESARLDDVVGPQRPIRAIKVDVEGGEEGVLRGGLETIARCRPYVIFEHGLGAADHYGTTPETIHDLLSGCGLRVTLQARWLAGEPDLSADEFVDEFASGRNYYFLAYADA